MVLRFTSVFWVCLLLGTEGFLQRNNAVLPKLLAETRETIVAKATLLGTESQGMQPDTQEQDAKSDIEKEGGGSIDTTSLTRDIVSRLRWRQLKHELATRDLSVEGTTAALRSRLKEVIFDPNKPSAKDREAEGAEECVVDMGDINFVDESDPEFEFKDLLRQVIEKSEKNHWKSGARRFKKLYKLVNKSNGSLCIPPEVYTAILQACAADRLQGARAAETARKIMEIMLEDGIAIPSDLMNGCIQNCIGENPDGTHEGNGGIDTALAMLSVADHQEAASQERKNLITINTYDRIIGALAREGGESTDEALMLLRSVIVDKSETPLLSTFASVAKSEVLAWDGRGKQKKQTIQLLEGIDQDEDDKKVGPEKVFNVLAYAKAAGYDLETIASAEDGRSLLASGVIAADRVGSIGVGLRLLQAAGKASGCQPDSGDILISLSSPTAERACTNIHKRAINTAVEDGNWQLAVKLLKLMIDRAMTPTTNIWRNVVTCCAKKQKSKKATSLLLDWAKLYRKGNAEKPPLTVFNTVLNACEKCDEQELTVQVLELMKKTHETEGNIITFNIALKRLAKLGYYWATEGIIVGMIESGIEPSVVSYTTAIAACAAEGNKKPKLAYEWVKRMRSRNVLPNVITYDTAMAACLDGTIESTQLGSKLATQMLEQIDEQLAKPDEGRTKKRGAYDEFTSVIPHYYTKEVSRKLMQQLKQNWMDGEIDKDIAVSTLRVPLMKLCEFSKSEAAEEAKRRAAAKVKDEDEIEATSRDELELEYSNAAHRTAEV